MGEDSKNEAGKLEYVDMPGFNTEVVKTTYLEDYLSEPTRKVRRNLLIVSSLALIACLLGQGIGLPLLSEGVSNTTGKLISTFVPKHLVLPALMLLIFYLRYEFKAYEEYDREAAYVNNDISYLSVISDHIQDWARSYKNVRDHLNQGVKIAKSNPEQYQDALKDINDASVHASRYMNNVKDKIESLEILCEDLKRIQIKRYDRLERDLPLYYSGFSVVVIIFTLLTSYIYWAFDRAVPFSLDEDDKLIVIILIYSALFVGWAFLREKYPDLTIRVTFDKKK